MNSQKIREILADAFLNPWRDKTRAFLMLAAVPALFGTGLQSMALIYTIAGEGPVAATAFHFIRMTLLGLIGISGSYWILSKKNGKYFLTALQLLGGFLFMIDPKAYVINGFAYVLVAAPLWAVYSYRNSFALSQENHGNEIALLNYLQVISISLGTFLGGLLLKFDLYRLALILSTLGFMLTTFLFAKPIIIDGLFKNAQKYLGWKRPACRLSFFVAILYSLIDFALPTWMRVIGLSPLSTGTSLALRPILGLFLTPTVGHMIKKGGLGAGMAGGAALCIGWIIISFAPTMPWLLLPALAFITIGSGLIGPTEVSRWYKRRSLPAIVAREGVLWLGRAVSILTVVPLVFLVPPSFPLISLFLGSAFVWGSRKKRKT